MRRKGDRTAGDSDRNSTILHLAMMVRAQRHDVGRGEGHLFAALKVRILPGPPGSHPIEEIS